MSMTVEDGGNKQAKPVPNTPSNVLEQFQLKGKVVIVNGAADGIGYAVAEGMVEAGADVAMWYNSNDAAIKKAAALAEKYNRKVKAFQVPVTDPKKIESTIEEVVKDFGKIDCFVANAGTANSKPILDMSLEEYHALTAVNSMTPRSAPSPLPTSNID